MNRRQRRAKVQEPYEEPWWKWAGVPNYRAILERSRLSREGRRELWLGALVTAAIAVAGASALFALFWIMGRLTS